MMCVLQKNAYIATNLYAKSYRKGTEAMFQSIPKIKIETLELSQGHAIKAAIIAFIAAMTHAKSVVISNTDDKMILPAAAPIITHVAV